MATPIINFHDVQFPADLTDGRGGYGFRGGPMFNTSILLTASGKEQRNINWMRPICKYNVGHILKDDNGKAQLLAFFNARAGMRFGFRFKDWFDYTVVAIPGGSSLGILYSETGKNPYRLAKVYLDQAGYPHIRIISKPCSGLVTDATGHTPATPQLFIGGTVTSAYTLDVNTGGVMLGSDPGWAAVTTGASLVTWSGEFDVPVRFSTDVQQLMLEEFGDTDWPSIELTELKLNLSDPTAPAIPIPPGLGAGGNGTWVGVPGTLTSVLGPALQFSSTTTNFVTGPLLSGDWQSGATLSAGGSITLYDTLGNQLFQGAFRDGTWVEVTDVNGTHTYTLTATLSDARILTLVANTGRGFFNGSTETEAPTITTGGGGALGLLTQGSGPTLNYNDATLTFTTGLLITGDMQNGGTFVTGGNVATFDSSGTQTFNGTFQGSQTWSLNTHADGTHTYTFTATLSDTRVLTIIANTGRGFFNGSTGTMPPTLV